MKASEMIGELTQLILKHGDHDVHFWAGALIDQSPVDTYFGDWDITEAGWWMDRANVGGELRGQKFIRIELKPFGANVLKDCP